jgi:hypothetical protein
MTSGRWHRIVTRLVVVIPARLELATLDLGPVGIDREFITAATRWIMEAKL